MVRLAAFFLAWSTVFITAGANAAPAEAPRGSSKTLPVSFKVNGGENWCSQGVTVNLKAKKAQVLTDGSEEFQQMLGRIRGAIESGCQKVRNIGFYGSTAKGEVSIGESLKITDWVYVPFKLEGKRPDCKGTSNSELCAQRWRVFYDIRSLFLKGAFSQAVLTQYLSTDGGADAEFVSGDAKGRVAFVPTASGVPFATASEFVAQQIEQQAGRCESEAQKTDNEAFDAKTAYQSVTCHAANGIIHSHFVITQLSDGFEVIAFSDFSRGGASGKRLAAELKAAVSGTPMPWLAIKSDLAADGTPAFDNSFCLSSAESFAPSGTPSVAILLRSQKSNDPNRWTLRIDQRFDGQTPGDPWQMRIKNVTTSEQSDLTVGAESGIWLVYRTAEDEHGLHFENQVYINAPNGCITFREPSPVNVSNLPIRAVELYTEGLGLGETGEDVAILRQALQHWEAKAGDEDEAKPQSFEDDGIKLQKLMDTYPVPLLQALSGFTSSCLEMDAQNSVVFGDDFITKVDIDGDGDQDYVANGDSMSCQSPDGSSQMQGGGNGGVRILVLSSTDRGPVLSLDTFITGGTITSHNGFAIFNGGENETYRVADGTASKIQNPPEGGTAVYTISR